MKNKALYFIATLVVCIFPVINVQAASEPIYYEDYGIEKKDIFIANGTTITIEENPNGEAGALIKWEGGSQVVTPDTTIFGGSHDETVFYAETNITMNGGTIRNIFGGGLHASNVGTAKVTINGGTLVNVSGGGSSLFVTDDDYDKTKDIQANVENAATAYNKVLSTTVTVNDGTFLINAAKGEGNVFGGGESYAYVGNATVIIAQTFTGDINYVTGGGSNGYTNSSFTEINGGNINVLQAVNRGFTEMSTITITGGTVKNAYASAEGDTQELGVRESATITVIGGQVENVSPGQSGNPQEEATSIASLIYNEGTVTNISQNFKAESILITVNLTFVADGEEETIQVSKGSLIDGTAIKGIANMELEETGYMIEEFYVDENLTTPYDFTKELNQDTTIYLKLIEITKNDTTDTETDETIIDSTDDLTATVDAIEELPPKTGDINIVGLIIVLLLSIIGIVVASIKRNSKTK